MRRFIFAAVSTVVGLIGNSAGAGLVLHYDFDNNVVDQSGNGSDGTIYGTPTFVSGACGEALEFNNAHGQQLATQYVLLPNSPGVLGLGAGSFTFYIRFKSTDGGPGHNNGRLFGVLNNGGSGFVINYNEGSGSADASASVYSQAGGITIGHKVPVDPRNILTDGEWHCEAVTVDRGSALMKYYIDGALIDTKSIAGMGEFSFANSTVGRTNGGNGNPTWTYFGARHTAVDDIQLYDESLSQSRIQSLCCPEPGTFVLALCGVVGLFAAGGRCRRRSVDSRV